MRWMPSQKKKGITKSVMPWEWGWSPKQQKKTLFAPYLNICMPV